MRAYNLIPHYLINSFYILLYFYMQTELSRKGDRWGQKLISVPTIFLQYKQRLNINMCWLLSIHGYTGEATLTLGVVGRIGKSILNSGCSLSCYHGTFGSSFGSDNDTNIPLTDQAERLESMARLFQVLMTHPSDLSINSLEGNVRRAILVLPLYGPLKRVLKDHVKADALVLLSLKKQQFQSRRRWKHV